MLCIAGLTGTVLIGHNGERYNQNYSVYVIQAANDYREIFRYYVDTNSLHVTSFWKPPAVDNSQSISRVHFVL